MSTQQINKQNIEVVVIGPDGKADATATLTEREVATVEAVDATLHANEQFRTAYPGAKLVRVDSNRGVDEKRNGRYYLRYKHQTGGTEFWGHIAKVPAFDFKKGVVGVQIPTPPPRATS